MQKENVSSELYCTISDAIDYLEKSYKGSSLTDIYFIVDIDSCELAIYDDEQNSISQTIIRSWADLNESQIKSELRNIVERLDFDNKFEKLDVYKPFSVNFADEDFVVLDELLLIEDDSVIRLEDDFLKRMDQDFDDFLTKLMKE